MTQNNFYYLNWLYQLVNDTRSTKAPTYYKLFSYLLDKIFIPIVSNDDNRVQDGLDLRADFINTNGRIRCCVKSNDNECSVLEMMVSLAIRCERHIMDNPEYGDRTSVWFWGMIDSLSPSLRNEDDKHFKYEIVDDIIERFIKRKYKANGEGGLFTVNNCRFDLRDAEIWYQMCWYLDTID